MTKLTNNWTDKSTPNHWINPTSGLDLADIHFNQSANILTQSDIAEMDRFYAQHQDTRHEKVFLRQNCDTTLSPESGAYLIERVDDFQVRTSTWMVWKIVGTRYHRIYTGVFKLYLRPLYAVKPKQVVPDEGAYGYISDDDNQTQGF